MNTDEIGKEIEGRLDDERKRQLVRQVGGEQAYRDRLFLAAQAAGNRSFATPEQRAAFGVIVLLHRCGSRASQADKAAFEEAGKPAKKSPKKS